MDQRKLEVIKHFNAWSTSYEQEVWTRDRYFHKLMENLVIVSIREIKEQKILELGAGPGIYMINFLQRGHYVIGLDSSREMLKAAKDKLKINHFNLVNLILADAEYLPFREKTFDIINCIEVIRHLPHPIKIIWAVFREMRRVIEKSGFILITVPNILFPLNIFSVLYYSIPRALMRFFKKGIGYHYNQSRSFPHFPVLSNEPEDHMFNYLFMKTIITNTNLRISKLRGIFFFPACPKVVFSILKKLDKILGTGFWAYFAYSFYIKLIQL